MAACFRFSLGALSSLLGLQKRAIEVPSGTRFVPMMLRRFLLTGLCCQFCGICFVVYSCFSAWRLDVIQTCLFVLSPPPWSSSQC